MKLRTNVFFRTLFVVATMASLFFGFQNCQKNTVDGNAVGGSLAGTSSADATEGTPTSDGSGGTNGRQGSDEGGVAASNQITSLKAIIEDHSLETLTYYFKEISPGADVIDRRDDLSGVQRPKTMQLDLGNGQLTVAGDSDVYCLNPNELVVLRSLLARSTVCRTEATAGQVCAMTYLAPYAVLRGHLNSLADSGKEVVSESIELGLGEQRSACQKVDLCNEQPQALKNFLNQIISTFSSRVCQ